MRAVPSRESAKLTNDGPGDGEAKIRKTLFTPHAGLSIHLVCFGIAEERDPESVPGPRKEFLRVKGVAR